MLAICCRYSEVYKVLNICRFSAPGIPLYYDSQTLFVGRCAKQLQRAVRVDL